MAQQYYNNGQSAYHRSSPSSHDQGQQHQWNLHSLNEQLLPTSVHEFSLPNPPHAQEATAGFLRRQRFAPNDGHLSGINPSPDRVLSAHQPSHPNLLDDHANPMLRWHSASDDAWSPQQNPQLLTGEVPQPCGTSLIARPKSPNMTYIYFSGAQGEDLRSTGSGHSEHRASDSGYGSLAASKSATSGNHANNVQRVVRHHARRPALMVEPSSTHTLSQAQRQSQLSQRHRGDHPCQHCTKTFKCQSDLHKHVLRYTKPHKCDISTCTKGFATVNDLDRHKRSVHHKLNGGTSYKCAGSNCKNPDKVWTRLDNFKQHLIRMHQGSDVNNLIQCSELRASPLEAQDTALAGVGGASRPSDLPNCASPSNFIISPERICQSWDPVNYQSQALNLGGDHEGTSPCPSTSGGQPADLGSTRGQGLLGHSRATGKGPTTTGISGHDLDPIMNSAGLTTLANIATASTDAVAHQLNGFCGNHSMLQSNYRVAEVDATRSVQTKDLGDLSSAIAAEITQSNPIKSLDKTTVLRVLNAAADLGLNESGHSSLSRPSRSSSSSIHDSATSLLDSSFLQSSSYSERSHEQSGGNERTITRAQVLKGLAFLAKLVKKRQRVQKPPSPDAQQCSVCLKWKDRHCDMNKHMKRHTKPYGCTFPKCNKSFGSKNDWKRHENSQHFQMEMWRCQLAHSNGKRGICAEVKYNEDACELHLKDGHGIEDGNELRRSVKACHIGRNGQGQFWCGFCRRILVLRERGVKAWDERFNHIDNDHFKKGQWTKDWLCAEENKTKGVLAKLMDRKFSAGSLPAEEELQDAEGSPAPQISGSWNKSAVQDLEDPLGNCSAEQTPGPQPSRKRRRDDDFVGSGMHEKKNIMYYCCKCESGPFSSTLYKSCGLVNPECDHRFCVNCKAVRLCDDNNEDLPDLNIMSY